MVNDANVSGVRLGLLFTGGEGPVPEQICAVLEAARARDTFTIVAAADAGLILAESAGVQPDWIIGDMDSLGASGLAACPPERVVRYPADKDFTDTEIAFSFLRERGCGEIWIVGGGGGRLDHLFAIRSLFERKDPPGRWITPGETLYCIQAPGLLTVDHTGCVSVFPLGDGPWDLESSGLRWTLAGLPWDRGFFGVSNEAGAGGFSVKAARGRFLIITAAPEKG